MRIKKTVGAAAASLGLVVSFAAFAAAAPNSSISHTGPDSSNIVRNIDRQNVKVKNTNHLGVHNSNSQYASTGDAETTHNTTGGGAMTGDASNSTTLRASVAVDNSASSAALMGTQSNSNGGTSTINTTGPDSVNKVTTVTTSNVDVQNNNDLYVSNYNHQAAISGDATVSDNTTGGSAVTGDAMNTSATTVTFDVSN